MKKTFKRAGVAVLSMAMLLSMGAVGAMSASAAGTDNGKVNVASSTGISGTVKFYKVAQQTDGAWAWTNDDYKNAVETLTSTSGATTFTTISGYTSAADKKALASALAKVVTGTATDVTVGSDTELAAGYWVGVPTAADQDAGKIYQPILVQIKNDGGTSAVSVSEEKYSTIALEKTITEVKNETGTAGTYSSNKSSNIDDGNKSAQVEEGSKVTYQLATQIPSYDSEATSVADFVLKDTPENTVVIDPTTVKVYLGAAKGEKTTEVSTNTTRTTNYNDDSVYTIDASGTGITATFKGDAIENTSTYDLQGKYVTVEFTATIINAQLVSNVEGDLTTSETKDGQGNYNKTELTYGNNFATGEGSQKLNDETYVYSTAVKIVKTDENDAALTGATFTLTSEDGKVYTATVNNNTHTFSGLAAGEYTLKETVVPADYKKIEDQTITISETGANKFRASGISGIAFVADNSDFEATVKNEHLDSLPGTGGMGTVLFTVGGAAIVLAAGAMFVVYMRKRKNEEQ